jgi:hypothetical protein
VTGNANGSVSVSLFAPQFSEIQVTPEPAMLTLLGVGLLGCVEHSVAGVDVGSRNWRLRTADPRLSILLAIFIGMLLLALDR